MKHVFFSFGFICVTGVVLKCMDLDVFRWRQAGLGVWGRARGVRCFLETYVPESPGTLFFVLLLICC